MDRAEKNTLADIVLANVPQPPATAPETRSDAEALAEMKKKRAAMERTPTICSQCLGGPTGAEFYVEQAGKAGKMMLCGYRCMGLWALTRGWPK